VRFLAIILFLRLLLSAQQIEIEINYGKTKEPKTVKIDYENGESALAVLSRAANVKTKKVGEFLFVTSIDGVASTPQKMGWFYSVDGKGANKTASANILTDAKTMQWEFLVDSCLSGVAR
jgi:hypothetical protein